MNNLSSLSDPVLDYLKVMLSARIDHARKNTDRGASAIEWAIITGMLALIAVGIYVIIKNKITSSAKSINTNP